MAVFAFRGGPRLVLMQSLFIGLVSIVLLSCGSFGSQSDGTDLGKQVYKTYCVACHGPDGKLMLNDAPDLSVSKMSMEERLENIRKGGSMMPAFAEVLSEEQIQAVAGYLEQLKEQN
ncbi:MAG: hypothetical protein EP314_05540 [Bacteroidetes bacterium]|nr:MAG: hypothetical protein EP314_05540 [Bacteroidota bacterium]